MAMNCWLQKYASALAASAVIMLAAASARAVTLGQLDDFQTAGSAGWGALNNTITTNVANVGPAGAGDNALDIEIQFKFIVHNESQWTGDYIAAGITTISMDVQHSNSFPLTLRLGISNGGFSFGGLGDTYESAVPIVVPNDGQWRRISFDVAPSAFVATMKNNNDSPNPAFALTNVTHLRIFHNPSAGEFVGETITGSFRVDNILAGPTVAEDADFDDDGDVDGQDLLTWQRNLGTGSQHDQGDADLNGAVDSADLEIWKTQFDDSVSPFVAVPEPATVPLALLVTTYLCRRRNR